MLTVGSLFSGIGGIDLGLQRAGFTIAWQVEIDPYCQRVLSKHWPDVPKFRDVRSVGAHNLSRIDVLCGGFPCQPHALTGKRKASADERDLWPEYARLIRELKPRYVLAENVPGILSSEHGRFFGSVLSDLAHLGYAVEWSVLSACALGAPHPRERVFTVAYTNGIGREWRGIGSGSTPRTEQNTQTIRDDWATSISRFVETAHTNATRPRVRRGAYGISPKVDRLRGLGNAVVPQVAEFVGRLIVEFEEQ
jgi:DNA (cytosine-5)-methyltransferase 1